MLRLGHRVGRDPRLTTHVALTARAFGAEKMFLHPPDEALAARVAAVARRFGGSFCVEGVREYRPVLREYRGSVVHLTMYGEHLETALRRLDGTRRLLVVVGGPKVPPEIFRGADYNVAVGPQPHSEVAALAVFLDRLGGVVGRRTFANPQWRIFPSRRGKRVRGSRGKGP